MAQAISFIPDSLDLSLYAGDGCAVRIVVRDKATGNVLPVTGTHIAQIRINRLDTDSVTTFQVDDLNADTGVIVVSLTGVQTQDLGDGFKGNWDLQWTPPDAEPLTLVQGKITCVSDVTRP